MINFTKALEMSIKTKNWYSVLFISLTLPDICGKIEEPNSNSSKQRTINWCDKYLTPIYTSTIGHSRRVSVFLSGSDFYALRCAYLHEGSSDITSQRAREVLENFLFIQPIDGEGYIHRNRLDNTLQLQVDEFGKDVLNAVQSWLNDIKDNPEKTNKINSLLEIKMLDRSKGFSL
ncbi:hypothetical protein [Gibbsiella quercinecans]|uniref:hypothetical protein n=1 Tax=Gibbsiella quercinecans TaxID=929813 RepID=UPI00242A3584|nr:hypothetical protein [Gibbsiella quercinecans]